MKIVDSLKKNEFIEGNVVINKIDLETGDILETYRSHNMVVKKGRDFLARAIAGKNNVTGTFYSISKIGVGTGNASAQISDYSLSNTGLTLAPLSGGTITEVDTSGSVGASTTFSIILSKTSIGATGDVAAQEIGLFYNDGTGDVMFSRFVFPTITISSSTGIQISWVISFPVV